MFALFKYLPLAALGKDIQEAYRVDTGNGIPFYMHRRFIGAVIALIAGFLAIRFGVTLDANLVASLTDNLEKMISAGVALYGAGLTIWGYFKRNKGGN